MNSSAEHSLTLKSRVSVVALSAFLMLFAGSFSYLRVVAGSHGNFLPSFITEREIYPRTVIALNYFDDGFVRRGLGGTIARMLSSDFYASGILFHIFSLVWLVVPLSLLVAVYGRHVSRTTLVYMAAVITLSPQTFLGWGTDLVRTDMLVEGFIAWSVFATIKGKPSLGVGLILMGQLAHETSVIFGLPLLVVLWLQACSQGTYDRGMLVRLGGLFAAGILMQVVAGHFFSPDHDQKLDSFARAVPQPNREDLIYGRDLAIYFYMAGFRGLKTVACLGYLNPQYKINALMSLLILIVYVQIVGLRRHYVMYFFVVIAPFLAITLIAIDIGRWLEFGVTNGWLLAVARRSNDPGAEDMPLATKISGTALLVVLLIMGPTHKDVPNSASHKLALALGLPDPVIGPGPLLKCDPDWLDVLRHK